MGWLIALAIVVLLAVMPLGISARYDAGGARARLVAGPVRIGLYPRKKKAGGGKTKEKKAEKPKKESKASGSGGGKTGSSLTDFLPLARAILDFLTEFRRKLRVNRLELKLILAGGDPCDLAVNAGKAWAIISGLTPQLERFFVIKRRELGVTADYTADKTLVIARLDLTITLGRLLSLGLRRGVHALVEFQKLSKQRKGGVKA